MKKTDEQAPRVERMSEKRLRECELDLVANPSNAGYDILAEAERARAAEEFLKSETDVLGGYVDELKADLVASRAREAELAEALLSACVRITDVEQNGPDGEDGQNCPWCHSEQTKDHTKNCAARPFLPGGKARALLAAGAKDVK